eukprot:TRINITY_DN12122_c0_g1_i1.p1 TRINITY_DN12122_c0_g1~~TRINITY_DN12122_c0_g1_i1.p1  ORF type:complete len:240 (-),score=43.06 TRINITY_DN12122_c0_g1_i1:397-1116(-)
MYTTTFKPGYIINYQQNYTIADDIYHSFSTTTSDDSSSSTEHDHINLDIVDDDFAGYILSLIFKKVGCKRMLAAMLERQLHHCVEEIESHAHGITLKEVRDLRGFLDQFSGEVDERMRGIPPMKYFKHSWNYRYFATDDVIERTRVALDFEDISSKMAEIIISESKLPDYMKLVKSSDIGGIAGGKKYIWNGILFKFAKDCKVSHDLWLYGGAKPNDFLAGKALSSDIKVFILYLKCRD